MIELVSGLDDSQLDRRSYLSLIGGELTAQQFIENVVLVSGGGHLSSMKAATGA